MANPKTTDETDVADLEVRTLNLDDAGGFHTIYLYYIREGHNPRIYEYYNFKNSVLVAEQRIDELVMNALLDEDDPPVYTDEHEYMIMHRKSYLAFVFESKQPVTVTDPVIFRDVDDPNNNGWHTFEYINKKATMVEKGGEKLYFYAIWYKNHLKRKPGGGDWGKDKVQKKWVGEQYNITLPFKAGERLLDPGTGGTNMGPPVPPPASLLARFAQFSKRLEG